MNTVAEVIPFQLTTQQPDSAHSPGCSQASLTQAVHVVFSSVEDTLIAAEVGHRLATALHVPLIIVHFQTVPYPVPLDRPADVSPVETEAFVNTLRETGIEADVRVLLCRDPARAVPRAFRGQSLVVLGGHPSRWPRRSASARMRKVLEAAGHVVVFVDTSASTANVTTGDRGSQKEDGRA